MSKRNVGNGSKTDLIESYSELVEITDGIRTSAYQTVAANAKVIQDLPDILSDLEKKNVKDSDVDRVISVAKTIGRDTDNFIKELDGVDGSFLPIKDRGVKSAKVAAKNYAGVLAISTKYHDITERLVSTTSELVNDFTDLCIDLGIVEDDEVEENVEETKSEE